MNDEVSLNTDDVMHDVWSENTRRRVHEEAQIQINGGTVRNEEGHVVEVSSPASQGSPKNEATSTLNHHAQHHALMTQMKSFLESNPEAFKYLQGTFNIPIIAVNSNNGDDVSLEKLQENKIDVDYNEDGSTSIFPPREFLINARKQ